MMLIVLGLILSLLGRCIVRGAVVLGMIVIRSGDVIIMVGLG